jgi:amino acid permease
MVGWSQGIGLWAQLVGSIFTLLAMLTTYWSLSLALAGMIEEMTHIGSRLCWLIATLPSMILVLFELGNFMELLRTAGGLIAIVVAVMVVPSYRNARREVPGGVLRHSGTWLEILIILAYILMAVGSVVSY